MEIDKFLIEDKYVNYSDVSVKELADRLSYGMSDKCEITKKVFYFVRDKIAHSFDINSNQIAARASDVIKYKNCICHAKAVLFAALLRYLGIPAGFCFQHIAMGNQAEFGYCIHAYNAVYLNNKWIKLDASGSINGGKDAEFSLEEPILPYKNRPNLDEYFIEGIYKDPQIETMKMLEAATDCDYVMKHIPDKIFIKPDIL